MTASAQHHQNGTRTKFSYLYFPYGGKSQYIQHNIQHESTQSETSLKSFLLLYNDCSRQTYLLTIAIPSNILCCSKEEEYTEAE